MSDDERRALARAMRLAAERWLERGEVEKAETYLRRADELLDHAYQSDTVPEDMQAAKAEKWRKPPSLHELAALVGCSQGFLSQAKAGQTRIRKSWADKIAEVRPDMPATKRTWPKGWAPEEG